MRTFQATAYRFSELTDKAKQHAKDKYAELFGYSWADDSITSLRKLAEHFGGSLTNWSIDFFGGSYSSASFSMPDDMTPRELRDRMRQLGTYNRRTGKGHGDCVLTGCFCDENAIDGLRLAYRAGKRGLSELMEAAFRSLLKAAIADCDDQYTDEQFGEHCDANDYEFGADGDLI